MSMASVLHEAMLIMFQGPINASDDPLKGEVDEICLGKQARLLFACWHFSCRESASASVRHALLLRWHVSLQNPSGNGR